MIRSLLFVWGLKFHIYIYIYIRYVPSADAGTDAGASSADNRSSKKIAISVDDPSLKDLATKVDYALRLATIATNKNRETEAVICSSVPIKKESHINTTLSAAHNEYLKKTKGNKGHGLGDGSTYRFGALILALASSGALDVPSPSWATGLKLLFQMIWAHFGKSECAKLRLCTLLILWGSSFPSPLTPTSRTSLLILSWKLNLANNG